MVRTVYARHGGLYDDIEDSVEEAKRILAGEEDHGYIYAIGIYDEEANTVFIADNEPIGAPGDWLESMLSGVRKACKLPKDHGFASVERYER